jgi:pentatricopeptide repeat protein
MENLPIIKTEYLDKKDIQDLLAIRWCLNNGDFDKAVELFGQLQDFLNDKMLDDFESRQP